jgi:predicted CopG family antitoxin
MVKKKNSTRRKGGSIKRSTLKSRSKSPGSSVKSRGLFQSPSPESLKNKCPICLETIRSSHIKTKCSHNFHKECLIQWCENQKQHVNTKCPMCKRDIQETCDKIIPFDSTKIFKYTNIAGADKKRKDTSTEKIKEFINNPNFDVNVENPNTGRSVLYTLTYSDPHHFYDYIKKLLENKKTKIDLDIISLLTSRYILDDEIIKLFKKNKKAKKMLKEFT